MLGILGLLLLAWLIISVYAFLSSLNQREKISRLEESVRNLREEIRRGNARNPEPEKAETSGASVSILQPPPVSPTVFNKQAEPLSETPYIVQETIREEDVPKFQEAPEARTPGRTQAEWEALIGGKILNRIGALALIIGVGFFLKYAFDNNWITETMRVLIGVATGAGLLIGGHYFQKKNYRIFSQGLAGSGIAILYLSVYSAFNFYHLVPQISAMFMMSAVTAITFWQAFKYDSQIIALFGWLGGFLTPFLLSTGQANETGLFSYISLLNFGLLFIATKKEKWFLLEPLCLLATILVFSLWFGEFYTDEALWITIGFSAVFWLLFMSVEIRRIVNTGTPVYFHHQVSSLVNGAFLYLSLYSAINPRHHEWMGLAALLLAVVYFVLFLWIQKKRPGDQLIQVRYLLSAVLLSVLAAGIQFKELEISIAWAIESFVLVVIAVRYRHLVTLLSGLFILILAAFAFTASNDGFEIPFTRYHFLYNMRALSLLTVFLSAYFSERIVRNFKQHYSSQIKTGLCYLWMLSLTALVTIETQNYSGQLAYIAETPYSSWIERMTAYVLAMEWMLLSIVLWYTAGRTQNRALSHGAFVLLCIGLFSAIPTAIDNFYPIELFSPLFNFRTAALLLFAVGLFLQSRWTDTYPAMLRIPKLSDLLRIGIVASVFVLLTVEIRDYFYLKIAQEASGEDILSVLYRNTWKNQQQLFISIAWLCYSMLLMVIGIYRQRLNVRLVSILLFGLTIAKVFFYDLSYLDSLHRIISFIGLGVILILVSFLYQKYKHIIGISGKKG